MLNQLFSAEVVSSVVLGGATLGAAGLNLLHEGRKARRNPGSSGLGSRWWRRPLLFLALSVLLVSIWVAYAAGKFDAVGGKLARVFDLKRFNRPAAAAAATTPKAAPTARPAAAVMPKREDWLQSEGTKLYYRFARYLPDACPGNPIAIGNWVDGETRPVVASCVDEEWLALDFAPLVAEGRVAPNMTYCLNFRAESGAWGLHVPERAPGLDSVVVPAVRVPLGRAIGLRYVKGLRERVVPTSDPPRAAC